MNFWIGRRTTAAAFALLVAMAPHVAPAAEDEGEDPVLATVNGEEIHRSDAMMAMGRLPAQMRQLPEEQILPVLVNVLIDTRLVADRAEEQGLPDEVEVQAQLAFARDVVLEQMLLGRYLSEQITEEALRERYDALTEESSGREEVKASHILVEDKATAEDAIAKLEEGADFAALAEEMSTGPSSSAGGDLGYFGREDMIPAFAEAAFALEPGSYTKEPVETEFGWHVIKAEDRRTAEPPPFEQVESQLRQQLAMDLRAKYLEELRADAEIERFQEAETGAGSGGEEGAGEEGAGAPEDGSDGSDGSGDAPASEGSQPPQ